MIAFLLSSLLLIAETHGSPVLRNPGPPTTELRPPPCHTKECELELMRLKIQSEYRNSLQQILASFQPKINPKPTDEEGHGPYVSQRVLSFGPPVPQSSPNFLVPQEKIEIGDIGVCSTIINQGGPLSVAKLYREPDRTVDMTHPIQPKRVKCKSSYPVIGGNNGKCVVVGYPHEAWVRVPLMYQNEYQKGSCFPIPASTDKQCFDYVIVAGYCVLHRPTG